MVWSQDNLFSIKSNNLYFSNRELYTLYEDRSTPLYLYSSIRIKENCDRLKWALTSTGLPFTIHYAMKANRFQPILDLIRSIPDIQIDACSPNEVYLALHSGFKPNEISVTASNLSNTDLKLLAANGIHLNTDSISVFKRYAALTEQNQTVGIRIDPPEPLHRENGEKLNYIGSKFGVSDSDFPEVYDFLRQSTLSLTTIHVHCGWAMQDFHEFAFEKAIERVASYVKTHPEITQVNIGGGLTHPHHDNEKPLSVEKWAELLKKHLQPLGVHIHCEIGTFIVANAGILLMEVTTLEKRKGKLWAGVNSGHSINVYPYHYQIPLEIIPVSSPNSPYTTEYAIGSNINEANDYITKAIVLPELNEGDILAMYPTGAYGSAMKSNHCLRGDVQELLI